MASRARHRRPFKNEPLEDLRASIAFLHIATRSLPHCLAPYSTYQSPDAISFQPEAALRVAKDMALVFYDDDDLRDKLPSEVLENLKA